MTFYPEQLSENHRSMLCNGSGVDIQVVEERGAFTARSGKDVPQTRGQLPKKPGLVLPVHTLDGETFYRLRPNNPGRYPKYLQPKGLPNRLDIHPRNLARIKQPGGMRYVVEGEKKNDSGTSRGLLIVGLSGVWNGQKDKELIPDWDFLPIEGEKYSICFDSDIFMNPLVQIAADRIARLLQGRGAEVFITLLPPGPNGEKVGLDDFFVNGGTVRELEMLTHPYDPALIPRARLSKDERLRLALEDLQRRFWDTEWKGMGGYSARDVYLMLLEAAKRHGKVVEDGVRVTKAQGPLAIEAKVSPRTLWKALNRLEEYGLLYRDNEGRKSDKAGAFVMRAKVCHYGQRSKKGEESFTQSREVSSGDIPLRAPRLRWSRPKFTPRRGVARGTCRVRSTPKPGARDRIERLGKVRGAIVDALDKAGGTATLKDLAETLHRKRPRDIRRRNLPMLEEAGIIEVKGDTVSLSAYWETRLNEVYNGLEGGGEADEVARKRYHTKRQAFHVRHNYAAEEAPTAVEMEAARKRGEERRREEAERPASPLAAAIHGYLSKNPSDACQPPGWIGTTLWAYDIYPTKPEASEVKSAISELGGERYLRDRLAAAREGAA